MIKKLLALLLLLPSLVFGATATFTADTTTVIPNPERGFMFNSYTALTSPSNFTGDLQAIRDGTTGLTSIQMRLALSYMSIGSGAIAGGTLTNLSTSLGNARTQGMKLVLRFVSTCSSVSCLTSQLAQLQSIIAANADIIHGWQLGFICDFGEWASNCLGLDTKANKSAVRTAIFNASPSGLTMMSTQVYPMMEDWYGTSSSPAQPLTAADAFTGAQKARLGFYSDCFLTGNGDSFFYPGQTTISDFTISSTRQAQRNWVAAASEYVPFGGEPCTISNGASQQIRSLCSGQNEDLGTVPGGITLEGPRYHLNYFNFHSDSGSTAITDAWVSGGCMNTVAGYMGYRIRFDTLSHADTVSRGSTLSVTLTMRNFGWSRIFQERRVKVTLVKAAAADITCTSANDLRKLPSQATASTSIRVQCAIPGGATVGSYAMHLSMPDRTPALSAVRAYMVRPANSNSGGQTWDDTLGRFATGTSVTVN